MDEMRRLMIQITCSTSSMSIFLTNSPSVWRLAADGADEERPRMACRHRRQWLPKALAPRRSTSEPLPEREDITNLLRLSLLRLSPSEKKKIIIFYIYLKILFICHETFFGVFCWPIWEQIPSYFCETTEKVEFSLMESFFFF